MTSVDVTDVDLLPVTYTVDGLTLGRHDRHGCWWVPQETEGWHEPVEARDATTDRPTGHGSFVGASYFNGREIVISGIVRCPTVLARNAAKADYAALCTDPGRLFELLVVDQDGTRLTAQVKRSGRPKFKLRGEHLADYQLTLLAPDPRKHDAAWQDPICNPPQNTVSGLDFGTDGLSFAAPGLDFGSAAALSQQVQVANYGTAPAFPLFKLTGPLSSPTIVHLESGRAITYAAEVVTGEVVRINCDDFPQRDYRGHSVQSTLRGNVRSLLTVGTEWPRVDGGTVATYALRSYGATSAELMCSLRPAHW